MLLTFSGCSILGNLNEIFTLGQYSREKDTQHALVKSTDDHYDALVKAIDQNRINDYKDQASFLYAFGEPILKKNLSDGQERWLYRHAIYRTAKDKVYVYFDHGGKMVKWERLPCPKLW
jgi:hypothetical protein